MSYGAMLTIPFGTPTLVNTVLTDQEFIQRGYKWGYDGSVWYCFVNPNRYDFEVWKKRMHWWHFGFTGLQIAAAIIFPELWPIILAFPTLIASLLFHYVATAKEQQASVVTNGPQMRLPGNLQFHQLLGILIAAFAVPTVAGLIIGKILGTLILPGIGTVSGTFIGGLCGAGYGFNAVALTLFLLGTGSVPYGDVMMGTLVENGAPSTPNPCYFLGCNSRSIGSYRIAPGEPAGVRWGSGGLTAIIVNGRPANAGLPGPVMAAYTRVMRGQLQLVVWGILYINPATGQFAETIPSNYPEEPQADTPPAGLILVAGSKAWSHGDTVSMTRHGVRQAVATDGHFSPLLGSSGSLVIQTWPMLDPIQRYGFMMVPD